MNTSRLDALAHLRAIVGALSQSARAVERHSGLTNAQLFVLQQLAAHGPLSVGELAVRAETQPSTASIVVSRLVAAGYLKKSRSGTDARRTELTLTPAARRLVRGAPLPPVALLTRALSSLPSADVRALGRGLLALRTALDLPATPPPLLFEPASRQARAR
ncbi:MAG: MarR family winged helix-turn-helix transcriptional regulator [Gemmatimonadaceae bacterium]